MNTKYDHIKAGSGAVLIDPVAAFPTKRGAHGLYIAEVEVPPMKGSDRNKPCPCNSGRKFKRCHGR